MSKRLKTFIIVCTILIVVGASLAGVGIMLGATGSINLDHIPWKLNENGGSFQLGGRTPESQAGFSGEILKDSIETKETVRMIKTKVGVGHIKFTEGDAFKVEYSYDKGFGKPEVKIEDETITIVDKFGRGGVDFSIKKWSTFKNCNGIEYEIFYPKGTTLELMEMDNNIGEIYISNIEIGTLNINHDIGNIELVNVNSDDVDIELSLGDIKMEDTQTDALALSSSVGDITVEGALKGKNIIITEMGNIKIKTTLPKSQYTLKFDAQLGDIKVNGDRSGGAYEVTNNSNNNIDAQTSAGDIKVEFQ
jgi:hypothetical protein